VQHQFCGSCKLVIGKPCRLRFPCYCYVEGSMIGEQRKKKKSECDGDS
jgi:hypothetical protein